MYCTTGTLLRESQDSLVESVETISSKRNHQTDNDQDKNHEQLH